MTRCTLGLHDWSRWHPFDREFCVFTVHMTFVEKYRQRICKRCGKVQEQQVSARRPV